MLLASAPALLAGVALASASASQASENGLEGVDASALATIELDHEQWESDVLDSLAAPMPATESGAAPDLLARKSGGLSLSDSFRLEYQRSAAGVLSPAALADDMTARERAEAGIVRDDAELHDASLRWDAARIGELTFSLRSGVRASRLGLPAGDAHSDSLLSPTGGFTLDWAFRERMFLRGGSIFYLDDDDRGVAELSAEIGMGLTDRLEVSFGYRTLESETRAPSPAAEDLSSAAFAAIRLRF